ncbi:MAG: class I SAM-dependent methyltransferase [Gemmataceae bacterium]
MLKRTPEPERMTHAEENDYALADYSTPHDALVARLRALAAEAGFPPGRLADLGTGPGDIPLRIAAVDRRWEVTAIDLSTNMLKLAAAAQRVRGLEQAPIQWVQADHKATGLPTGHFQALVSNSVLHHMPTPDDARGFWAELKRLAAPGAVVLVRDLVRPPDEAMLALLLGELRGVPPVALEHYRSSLHAAYTVEEIRDQLHQAGLTLEVLAVGDRHLEVSGQVR